MNWATSAEERFEIRPKELQLCHFFRQDDLSLKLWYERQRMTRDGFNAFNFTDKLGFYKDIMPCWFNILQWQVAQWFPDICCVTSYRSTTDSSHAAWAVLPCHELLRGLPFSQMSVMCLASGILSLHEWDRPLDLQQQQNSLATLINRLSCLRCLEQQVEGKWRRRRRRSHDTLSFLS